MSRRSLPSVDRLASMLVTVVPRGIAVEIARAAIADARSSMADEANGDVDPETTARAAAHLYGSAAPTSVINATGVLLHTNLGRAPLHADAVAAMATAAAGSTNLEIEMQTGRRGSRLSHLVEQLKVLTGAESALVVNNNAGALLLVLATLAHGRPVPVSRGEMIEIGGSYRLPELIEASGARMIEIGTTNRTRIADHMRAVEHHDDVGMLLKVHPSNYRVTGFTEDTRLSELVELGRDRSIPVVFDVGSGLIDERVPWIGGPPPSWLAGEPGVLQSIEAGVDLVLFSGDKLLGGPQAGVVVGNEDLVARLRAHPFARALRVDGPTIGALAVTLDRYLDGKAAELPFWAMATADIGMLRSRALSVVSADIDATISPTQSTIGAGSVPGATIDSVGVIIDRDVDGRYLRLLAADTPVVGRRVEGRLVLDLRTVLADQVEDLARSLAAVCR